MFFTHRTKHPPKKRSSLDIHPVASRSGRPDAASFGAGPAAQFLACGCGAQSRQFAVGLHGEEGVRAEVVQRTCQPLFGGVACGRFPRLVGRAFQLQVPVGHAYQLLVGAVVDALHPDASGVAFRAVARAFGLGMFHQPQRGGEDAHTVKFHAVAAAHFPRHPPAHRGNDAFHFARVEGAFGAHPPGKFIGRHHPSARHARIFFSSFRVKTRNFMHFVVSHTCNCFCRSTKGGAWRPGRFLSVVAMSLSVFTLILCVFLYVDILSMMLTYSLDDADRFFRRCRPILPMMLIHSSKDARQKYKLKRSFQKLRCSLYKLRCSFYKLRRSFKNRQASSEELPGIFGRMDKHHKENSWASFWKTNEYRSGKCFRRFWVEARRR